MHFILTFFFGVENKVRNGQPEIVLRTRACGPAFGWSVSHFPAQHVGPVQCPNAEGTNNQDCTITAICIIMVIPAERDTGLYRRKSRDYGEGDVWGVEPWTANGGVWYYDVVQTKVGRKAQEIHASSSSSVLVLHFAGKCTLYLRRSSAARGTCLFQTHLRTRTHPLRNQILGMEATLFNLNSSKKDAMKCNAKITILC